MVRQAAIFPILILIVFAVVVIPELGSHQNAWHVVVIIIIIIIIFFFFLSFGLWVTYALLFRVPYELVMQDGTFSWRTKLQSDSASIDEIDSVRLYQFAQSGVRIMSNDGRTLIVLIRPGFNAFACQLALWVRPGVVVGLGREGRQQGK